MNKNSIIVDKPYIKLNIFGIKIKIRKNRHSYKSLKLLNWAYEDFEQNKYIQKPQIATREETLNALINSRTSICRYGDGEFNLIFGSDLPFQKYSEKLSDRLKEILKSNNSNILVGLSDVYGNLDEFTEECKRYFRQFVVYNRMKIYSIIDLKKQYYNAEISRFYMGLQDKSRSATYIKMLKNIWKDKDIVIVEGEFSRLGCNNDLFANAKSIQRVICPAINAFSRYDEILEFCKTLPKEKLFILALGPTATVLAYDLATFGFQALDLGHIDIEYEWLLMGATKKVPIKNKYVNEAKSGRIKTSIANEKYKSEIIANLITDKNL